MQRIPSNERKKMKEEKIEVSDTGIDPDSTIEPVNLTMKGNEGQD